jgi:hypothetical protein
LPRIRRARWIATAAGIAERSDGVVRQGRFDPPVSDDRVAGMLEPPAGGGWSSTSVQVKPILGAAVPAPAEVVRCCAPAGRPPVTGSRDRSYQYRRPAVRRLNPYIRNTISTVPEIVSDYWSCCVRPGSWRAIREAIPGAFRKFRPCEERKRAGGAAVARGRVIRRTTGLVGRCRLPPGARILVPTPREPRVPRLRGRQDRPPTVRT